MKWNFENLGNVCTVLDNKRQPITKHQRVSGIYPYYGATGIVDYVNDFIFDERLVLVGEDGAKWKSGDKTAFIVEGKVWVNNHAHVLKPTSNLIDSFLIYFLNHQDLTDYITGLTVPKLNQEKLRSIPIPIPPLPEQREIVEKLDFAFDAIEKAKANIEKNIENAKELFQSKLNEIFSQKGKGWEEKTLKSISIDFGRGKSKHRPRNFDKLYGGKYPFIQTGDIRNSGMYVLDHTQTYSELGLAQSKLWPKNTICITIAANIAESAITTFDCCFPDSVIGLVVDKNKANIFYTYYALQFLKSDIQSKSVGFAQQNINLATFDRQFFPFPKNLTEQNKYVTQLDQLLEQTNLLQEKYKQKHANLEELKKSILEKAFKGELV